MLSKESPQINHLWALLLCLLLRHSASLLPPPALGNQQRRPIPSILSV